MKASNRSVLRNAALSLAGLFGGFGDRGKPKNEVPSEVISGLHKFEPGASRKKRHTAANKSTAGRGHRRRYLVGKPGFASV